MISGVEEWSLFLRLNYKFPLFGVTMNSAKTKLHHGVNQWTISEILDLAGVKYEDIAAAGPQ